MRLFYIFYLNYVYFNVINYLIYLLNIIVKFVLCVATTYFNMTQI